MASRSPRWTSTARSWRTSLSPISPPSAPSPKRRARPWISNRLRGASRSATPRRPPHRSRGVFMLARLSYRLDYPRHLRREASRHRGAAAMITSGSNQHIALLRALHTPKGRAEHGALLIEGPHLLEAALDARITPPLVV